MKFFKTALILFLLLIPPNVSAVEVQEPQVDLQTKYMPASDLESQAGEIYIIEAHILIRGEFTIFEDIPLEVSIGGNHYVVDDKDVALDLPDGFKSRGVHVDTRIPLDDFAEYFLGIGVNPTFQSAKGIKFTSRTFRIRPRGYLVYNPSEEFSIEGGVTWRSEYNEAFFPHLGLNWSPNEDWYFEVDTTESEVSSMVKFQISEKNAIFWEADFELDEFEVQRDADEGRVIEYSDISTGIGLEHTFNEHFIATASAGGVFERRIEYLDGTGKVNIEESPYFGIDLIGRF